MRHLLFILCFLPSIALAYKGTFNYNKVTMFAEGSDGFSINHCMENEKQGCLLIAHSSIKIGAKEYRMKSTNERNIYKIKGGIVKLVFNENKELVSVQIRQYNQAYRFDKKYDFE